MNRFLYEIYKYIVEWLLVFAIIDISINFNSGYWSGSDHNHLIDHSLSPALRT